MMFPILQVGPLAIRTPGLILLIGVWLGLSLAERQAKFVSKAQGEQGETHKHQATPGEIDNLIFISLIAAVIGARLAYVLEYPQIFAATPLSAISLDTSLLDPWGAAGAGLLVAMIYGSRKKLAFWETLDSLAPFFAVVSLAIGFSHLASGDAFGAPTSQPWGIELWGAHRQPTQIYEILAAGIVLVVIWPRAASRWAPGMRILIFVALSASGRLLLESFRGDSILLPGGFRQAQVIALIILAICFYLIRERIANETRKSTGSQELD